MQNNPNNNDDHNIAIEMSSGPAFTPVEFAWQHINYSVELVDKKARKENNNQKKQILFDISGVVKPGEVMAIMGASGAGKTTLLDILSNRAVQTDGKILFNGKELKGNQIRKIASYVTQHDMLTATMTVRETFNFYANLKLPKTMTADEKKERVDKIIQEMYLTRCQDNLVGNEFIRGISGGEKRRVSIGIELLTQPSLLFLDEPTSGLDSSTALAIMNTISQLAKGGRTIVCTIHQPRHDIFFAFHKVMFLAKGQIVFSGPVRDAITYFAAKGFPCERFVNPADHIIDTITLRNPQDYDRVNKLVEEFKASEYFQQITVLSNPDKLPDVIQAIDQQKDQKVGQWHQFVHIFGRRVLEIKRNPIVARMKVVQNIIQALLFGVVFLRLGYGQTSPQSRAGVMLMTLMGSCLGATNSVIHTFPSEKALFKKDRSGKVYSVFAYYMGLINADILFLTLMPIIYSSILYWMVNLNNGAANFFIFMADMVLLTYIGNALGICISIAAPREQLAHMFTPLISLVIIMFSGYILNFNDIPVFLRWVPPVSFLKWALEIMFVNEFVGVKFTCTDSQKVTRIIDGVTQTVCPIQTGEDVLKNMRMSDVNIGVNFVILISFLIGLRILGYAILWYTDRRASHKKAAH